MVGIHFNRNDITLLLKATRSQFGHKKMEKKLVSVKSK